MSNPAVITALDSDDASKGVGDYILPYRIAREIIRTGSLELSFEVVYELTKSLYNYLVELPKNPNAVLKTSIPVKKQEQLLENLISKSDDVLVTCLALTVEFIQGIGPETRVFNNSHILSKSLKDCNATTIVLNEFYKGYIAFKEGRRPNPPEYWSLSFPEWDNILGNTNPLTEYAKDLEFTTIQFIGSAKFYFDYNDQTRVLHITVNDTKNHNSLFLHMTGENYSRSQKKEFGTTYQTYHFSLTMEEIKSRLIK